MILSLWTAFRALPRGWHYLAAGVIAVIAFLTWDYFDDRAAVKRDRAEQAAKVLKRQNDAEKAAVGTVAGAHASTAARIDAARDAASGSDDPLKAGMDELRRR